jgi:sodium-dependent phosphate cotransporter
MIGIAVSILLFFLYFFLVGLDLLSEAAKALTGCVAGGIFGTDTNPIAGLMVGIIATVLLQSSSTTTSIIVTMVGSGLSVNSAIYMIMGANIGTSVTNTIVAMGQLGDGDQLERAFAGATVHDMFNFLAVLILLPLEVITHYLYHLTKAMLPSSTSQGATWDSPIKIITNAITKSIIIANKNVIKEIADKTVQSCDEYYPTACPGGRSYKGCTKVGIISCNKNNNMCPAFFQEGAYYQDDTVSAGVCLFIALVVLIGALLGLVAVLQKMLMGMSARVIYKATNVNGYVGMLVGAVITMLVQSSSITTSTLTPLVGLGVIRLEQMYPLTLGANIGTTITGLLASMVSDSVDSIQVALCHLFFNISGIIIWYPIPSMRRVPLYFARQLGKATRVWKFFPAVYIAIAFFLLPIALLGVSSLFQAKTLGLTVLGSLIVIAIVLGLLYFAFKWRYRQGQEKCIDCVKQRQRKADTMKSLPDNMDYILEELVRIKEFTGLPDKETAEKDVEQGKAKDA